MQLFSYYKPHISSYISCFIYNSIGFANVFFKFAITEEYTGPKLYQCTSLGMLAKNSFVYQQKCLVNIPEASKTY